MVKTKDLTRFYEAQQVSRMSVSRRLSHGHPKPKVFIVVPATINSTITLKSFWWPQHSTITKGLSGSATIQECLVAAYSCR
jgi:hypothetical protein